MLGASGVKKSVSFSSCTNKDSIQTTRQHSDVCFYTFDANNGIHVEVRTPRGRPQNGTMGWVERKLDKYAHFLPWEAVERLGKSGLWQPQIVPPTRDLCVAPAAPESLNFPRGKLDVDSPFFIGSFPSSRSDATESLCQDISTPLNQAADLEDPIADILSCPIFASLDTSEYSWDKPQQENLLVARRPSSSGLVACPTPQTKCRQLPCKSFISTGSCPYNDRCIFLHDPRVCFPQVHYVSKRKPKDDQVTDSFFWTPMDAVDVMQKRDPKNPNIPHVSQPYLLHCPTTTEQRSHLPCTVRDVRTAIAVDSMWSHFVDFTAAAASGSSIAEVVDGCLPGETRSCENAVNQYTGKPRLPVFVSLSQGRSVT